MTGYNQEIVDLLQRLRPLSAQHALKDLHWVHGADEALDYCADCGEKEVERLKAEKPDEAEDIFLDGGWGGQSSDSCPVCEKCGCQLDASLTDYGARAELAHFEENPPETASAELAVEIERVLESFQWGGEAEDVARAAALGRAFVALAAKDGLLPAEAAEAAPAPGVR
jgi:hypothetical protein